MCLDNIILLSIIIIMYLLINNYFYCKLEFNNNNNNLTFDKIYELNKSKFYSIKDNKNEKSLLSKINNYVE